MVKDFKSAPLPFQGQKKNFIKEFKKALEGYPKGAIYVDLFGGSGLLSHTVKTLYPEARVVYNDYDNFKKRLEAIPETNRLLGELRALLEDCPRKGRITGKFREKLLELIKTKDSKGYVDYITLSSSILFSMNYVQSWNEFEKQTFYNRVRLTDYESTGYLEGVEFVTAEYKEVFDSYKDDANVVFLVDPPYLSTDCTTYKNYWKLADYLDVLKVLIGSNYFYFTSNKSSIVELCEWIESNTGGVNPFNGAEVVYRYNKASYNSKYTDVMLHKRWTTDIA